MHKAISLNKGEL